MTETTPLSSATPTYDETGKLSLDHVYNRPDPRDYFSTLHKLGYKVPGLAKPFFRQLLEAKRAAKGEAEAKIVDVGCSYGVNAALLKHDLSLEELFSLYGKMAPDDPDVLLKRDRALFAGAADENLAIVGVDAAENAIAYAVEAGILDGGVSTNMELEDPTADDIRAVENSDLIISTGCVGYVTTASLGHLVEASQEQGVWMANFVLRMFDYEPVKAMLDDRGYITERLEGVVFPQRRFVSSDEREHVFENLNRLGRPIEQAEKDGWYLAELHVSRPTDDAATPLDSLFRH